MVVDAMPIFDGVSGIVVAVAASNVVSIGIGVVRTDVDCGVVVVFGAAMVSPNARFFFMEGLDPIILYCPGLISP